MSVGDPQLPWVLGGGHPWVLGARGGGHTSFGVTPPSLVPTAMEGLGFLDALNSAPIPGIKIKKKKKVLSPTAAKVRGRFPG